MKIAAGAFYGFFLLTLIDIVAVLLFNPSRHDLVFLVETFVFCGGLLIWSFFTARRLTSGSGLASAFAMLGTLTAMIVIGAAITYAHLEDFPGKPPHPVLAVLRIVSGLYVLLLWAVTVRAYMMRRTAVDL